MKVGLQRNVFVNFEFGGVECKELSRGQLQWTAR